MNILFQISLFFILTSVLGFILRYLKQPLFLAYILAGLGLGGTLPTLGLNELGNKFLLQLCISFLLFYSALQFRTSFFKELGLGFVYGVTGFLTSLILVFTILFQFLKIETPIAFFLASVITFSSLFFPIKYLSDSDDTHNLHGKITLTVLLAQSFLMMVVGVVLSSFYSVNESLVLNLIQTLLKLLLVLVNSFLLFKYILPRFYFFIFKSPEFTLVFSISWGLLMASIFQYIGLPFELGALSGGFFLSGTKFAEELLKKLDSLRNIFLMVFFLSLGGLFSWTEFSEKFLMITVLTILSLLLKPVIFLIFFNFYPFSKRTALTSTFSLVTLGEGALVLLLMLNSTMQKEYLTVIISVMIITFFVSSYLNNMYDKLFHFLEKRIGLFSETELVYEKKLSQSYEVILLGCGQIGLNYLRNFESEKDKVLILESNLEIVEKLQKSGWNSVFGDVEDPELLDQLKFKKSKMIFSSIKDLKTNLVILKKLKKMRFSGVKIVISRDLEDALELYALGASYVILPNIMAMEEPAKLVSRLGFEPENYLSEQNLQFNKYYK
jgi:Kef-type K+ transport system membrane component KefB